MNKQTHIIIFSKAPQAGFAKTRLIPALGAEGAAQLARAMLFRTLRAALDADVGVVELCVTPDISDAAWQGITLPEGIAISVQEEGDLGARMAYATECAMQGGNRVMLVGTDCAEMSAILLRTAAYSLRDHDAVIYCTRDGGYALLGMKQFSQMLFEDIKWSTSEVSRVTLDRMARLDWAVQIGELLHDMDEAQDLRYLPDDLKASFTV